MKKVLKKDEQEPQKDEKEDTKVIPEKVTTADVPKEDAKDDKPAQDPEVENSEQEMKSGACLRVQLMLTMVNILAGSYPRGWHK